MSNKATIYITGEIGVDVELIDVVRQFKSFDNPTEAEIIIDSNGGFVNVGKSIHNYIKSLDISTTTIAKGMCASIASYIFFAGDTRQMYEDAEIMIHLPSGQVGGTAQNIEDYSKTLRDLEAELAAFYTPFFNLDDKTIYALLEQETWIDSGTAMDMGIVNSILVPLKAVAKFDNNKEDKNDKMNKKEKSFFKAFKDFFTEQFEETEPTNLMVQDANGDEINFPELDVDDTPTVKDGETAGSKAVDSDNNPIEGERTAINGDVWVFEAGELIEIKKAESEEETEEAEVEDKVEEEITDEFDAEALIEQITDGVVAKVTAMFTEENKAVKAELNSLKKLVGSEDTSIAPTNMNNNTNSKSTTNYLSALRK